MKRFLAKLAFAHRHLWERDTFYCVSVVIGPAVLVGAVLAAIAWSALAATGMFDGSSGQKPPAEWAKPANQTGEWPRSDSTPNVVAPFLPLPTVDANGTIAGFPNKWSVQTRLIQFSATYNWTVTNTTLSMFTHEGASIDIERLMAGVSSTSQYVGVGAGLLVVRTPGIYALSARFERPASGLADCLSLLGFGGRRIFATLRRAMVQEYAFTFPAARFDLKPGLYGLAWEFGCWRNGQMTGPGKLTMLIEHPGESTLTPLRTNEVVMPLAASP
jgi:hypothetical protein